MPDVTGGNIVTMNPLYLTIGERVLLLRVAELAAASLAKRKDLASQQNARTINKILERENTHATTL